MSPRQHSRRDFLKTAGITLGAVTGAGIPDTAGASTRDHHAPLAAETLADYGSHTWDGRTMSVTSTAGQQVRITAYGGYTVRVRFARGGEAFFADSRYEMVDPASHAAMGGTLDVRDDGAAFTITTAPADGVRIVLRKRPLRIAFYSKNDGALLAQEDATHSMSWGGTDGGVVRQTFAPPAVDERFCKGGHGLYGRAPRVDRTGEIVSHNYPLRSHHLDQAPAIVPFYLSSRGYAVFFNTTFDTTFNFGNGGVYEFWADNHSSSGVKPQLDYFVIKGPRFAALLDRYTRLTGRPRFPQIGFFGLHLSDKNYPSVSDQSWWTEKIIALRGAGFPLDVQVHDNRWREGSGSWSGSWFQFSAQRWPDPAGFKRWADEHGVLTTLDYNRNNSNEMAGWVGGPPPGYSFRPADLAGVGDSDAVPDWTNPATRAWVWKVFWDKALNPALGFPGDALWIDEPDEMGPIPYDALAANGQRWSELRNAYFLYLQKGVGQEGWDPAAPGHIGQAKRPWIFTRGATAGQQRYGHLWTGDIESTYAEMREQIRGMQNAGLGGFPYSNIDGGGFRGVLISGALYRNWVAAWSSLSPIWRPHSEGNTAVSGARASRWPIDQAAAERTEFMKYAKLRYTMLPYIYTIAHAAHATGMPMARAMVIDHQTNAMAYSHDLQYMWGPSILVMPVTTDASGAVQQVWLPAGDTWYNFWSDAQTVGSDTSEKAYVTRTGETIMYVKAGSILPRYKYAQSTRFLDKTHLEMDAYLGKDGSFAVYEDDGTTEDFRAGAASSLTNLSFDNSAMAVTIDHPVGTYRGAPRERRYIVRIHGLASPIGMRIDNGTPLPAFTSETAAVLHGSGQVWDDGRKVLSVVSPMIAVHTGGGAAAVVRRSGLPFPAPASVTVYGAEDATLSGAVISTRHSGYTGGGYADYTNPSGDFIEWSADVATSGSYTLSFRYANGGTTDRPLTISVNGAVVDDRKPFAPTGGWQNWASTTVTTFLSAGVARIRATAVGSGGGNVDCLAVRGS